jgi:hypothetical protein
MMALLLPSRSTLPSRADERQCGRQLQKDEALEAIRLRPSKKLMWGALLLPGEFKRGGD